MLSFAILEVPTKNSVIANRDRLFIIRLTESQLLLCDCQQEGQTETAEERAERETGLSPPRRGFLHSLAGNGHQVALDPFFVVALTYP